MKIRTAVASLLFLGLLVVAAEGRRKPAMDGSTWRRLDAEERRVIVDKGTERPHTGRYVKHREAGTYLCRRCGAALYGSADKFDSGCGWPAFDDEIAGAVLRLPDGDGRRTEILCAACGGHLGHVFEGEGLTEKNVRHCVNSISLHFLPARSEAAKGRAILAGGCFWGVEYWLAKEKGVLEVTSGYTGGHVEAPTYEQVCGKETGHLEAVDVRFDPAVTDFEGVVRRFFEIHDPTQADGQGPDLGPQYLSAIFVLDDAQRRVAEKLIGELRRKGFAVATRILPAEKFWPAEGYHQDYYERKGSTPYCHVPQKRF